MLAVKSTGIHLKIISQQIPKPLNKIGHQDSTLSKDHQRDMPYCDFFGNEFIWETKATQIMSRSLVEMSYEMFCIHSLSWHIFEKNRDWLYIIQWSTYTSSIALIHPTVLSPYQYTKYKKTHNPLETVSDYSSIIAMLCAKFGRIPQLHYRQTRFCEISV